MRRDDDRLQDILDAIANLLTRITQTPSQWAAMYT
jgi:hypothetical protein